MFADKQISRILVIVLFSGSVMSFTGCHKQNQLTENVNMDNFQIVILNDDINKQLPGLGYSNETAWPVLQNSYPQSVIFQVITTDIESYDWNNQVIILTEEASTNLENFFSTTETTNIENIISNHPFLVIFDNEPIYGGLFLSGIPIATSYDFPIIYPKQENNKISLTIKPNNSILRTYSVDEWKVIKDDRIKKYFDELGKSVTEL